MTQPDSKFASPQSASIYPDLEVKRKQEPEIPVVVEGVDELLHPTSAKASSPDSSEQPKARS